MLTLITGTPGAGKSLYTVWEIARHVPGSTIEQGQTAVPRKLYSNIKDLLLEHEHITGEDLEKWHEWCRPGDVIVFDEVQEVWRPRGLGTKVPECIAALETHRHKGVDIVLITQHPMLVDPNIRRLVNQHIHLRRITKTVAMAYEWDHCANPGSTRTAIQSRVWFHPKKAYDLYKSAQLHTKPTSRIPRVAYLGLAALAGLAYLVPTAYGRITTSLGANAVSKAPATVQASAPQAAPPGQLAPVEQAPVLPDLPASMDPPRPVIAGCIGNATSCSCFSAIGEKVESSPAICESFTRPPPLAAELLPDPPLARVVDPADLDALQFIAKQKGPRS